MEDKSIHVCASCGAQNTFGGRFCINCGSELHIENEEAVSAENDASLASGDTDASPTLDETLMTDEVSSSIDEDESPNATAEEERSIPGVIGVAKTWVDPEKFKKDVWGNAIALVLSLIFLLLAVFSPVLSMKTSMSGLYEGRVHISAVDNAIFAFDSGHFLASEQLAQSELYRECDEELSQIFRDSASGSLNPMEQEAELLRLWKPILRLALRSENVPMDFGLLLSGVCSLGYIALCLWIFVVTLLRLIRAIRKKENCDPFSSIGYACAVPFFLPVLYFLMNLTYKFGERGVLSSYAGHSLEGDWGFVLPLLLAALALIGAIVWYFYTKPGKKPVNRGLWHAAIAVFALLMIGTAFMPTVDMRLHADVPLKNDTISVKLSGFYSHSLEEVAEYNKMSASYLREVIRAEMTEYGNLPDISSSFAQTIEAKVGDQVMLGTMAGVLYFVYWAIMLITVAHLIFAGYLLGTAVLGIFSEERSIPRCGKKRWIWVRIMTWAMLFSQLFVYGIALFRMYALNLVSFMDFHVGIGILVSFLCILGAHKLLRKKKKKVFFDTDYDNADLSYAPYVLDQKE
ncbi:MAG: zinc ribbon domain-containing protein [Ruminococcaceae bacterium]|nr:zinc ribbon domain-containing protein [Oscillospiraceae bacterium]